MNKDCQTTKKEDMDELTRIALDFHNQAKIKGFWDEPREFGTVLMLIVTELSEALEADRIGNFAKINDPEFIIDGRTIRQDLELAIKENDLNKFADIFRDQVKDTVEDEIADTFIRLFDLVGYLGIDIDKHIEFKMKYNKTRSYKHDKAY